MAAFTQVYETNLPLTTSTDWLQKELMLSPPLSALMDNEVKV